MADMVTAGSGIFGGLEILEVKNIGGSTLVEFPLGWNISY